MPNETYNGWKNYPTWAVHLWLTNEQGSYDYARALASTFAGTETARMDTADSLRDWIREETEPDAANLQADLIGHSLDSVDWFEIADAFLEE